MAVDTAAEPSAQRATPAPRRYVLDAFALLAYLRREPGWRTVRGLLRDAANQRAELSICVINLGEVLYMTERKRSAEQARAALGYVEQLPLQTVDADQPLTLRAARIKACHRVSYADAFAVALAQELDATVVTGDPEFRTVEEVVRVRWLRGQVHP